MKNEADNINYDDGIIPHLHIIGDDNLWVDGGVAGEEENNVKRWPFYPLPKAQEPTSMTSGMDKLLFYVTRKLESRGLRVYISLTADSSTFCAEFMVVLQSPIGEMYTATYITSWLAIGIEHDDIIRDGDIVIEALAKELAMRAWVKDTPAIPSGALVLAEAVRK